MGIETIVFEAAGAGAMAALTPTSAIIRPGTTDAFIVGVIPMGVTLTQVVLTAAQDPRWDAAGFTVNCRGNGGIQDADSFEYGILPKKVPIKRGITLAAVQTGAGVGYCFVYVDYPDIGVAYAPRNYLSAPGAAQMTTRLATAGGAVTVNTIAVNSTQITNFTEGRTYQLLSVDVVTGGTGPEIAIGFTDPHTTLMNFFVLPLTRTLESGVNGNLVPEGVLTPIKRGETLQIHFVSANADTPAANLNFAHDSGQ